MSKFKWPAPGEKMESPNSNASKLSFERRCAILLLWRKGAYATTLATMFHVSVDTIRAIYRENPKRYADVRHHCNKMGEDACTRMYLNRNLIDTVNRLQPGSCAVTTEEYSRLAP